MLERRSKSSVRRALGRYRAQPFFISAVGDAAPDIAALPVASLRFSQNQVTGLWVLVSERTGDLLGKPRPVGVALWA